MSYPSWNVMWRSSKKPSANMAIIWCKFHLLNWNIWLSVNYWKVEISMNELKTSLFLIRKGIRSLYFIWSPSGPLPNIISFSSFLMAAFNIQVITEASWPKSKSWFLEMKAIFRMNLTQYTRNHRKKELQGWVLFRYVLAIVDITSIEGTEAPVN